MTVNSPYAKAQTFTIGQGDLAGRCHRSVIFSAATGRPITPFVIFFRGDVDEELYEAMGDVLANFGTCLVLYVGSLGGPMAEEKRREADLAEASDTFDRLVSAYADPVRNNNETTEAHLLAAEVVSGNRRAASFRASPSQHHAARSGHRFA